MGGICAQCSNRTKGRRKLCGGCMKSEAKRREAGASPAEELPPSPGAVFAPPSAPEPAWAQLVRDYKPEGRVLGPPPFAIPEDPAKRVNLDKPFVELTLCEHGRYTGPTRGRVLGRDEAGFTFLTAGGLYFVTWSNVAFWTFLSEV